MSRSIHNKLSCAPVKAIFTGKKKQTAFVIRQLPVSPLLYGSHKLEMASPSAFYLDPGSRCRNSTRDSALPLKGNKGYI